MTEIIKIAEYVNGVLTGYGTVPRSGDRYIIKINVNRDVTRKDLEFIVNKLRSKINWGEIRAAIARGRTIYIDIRSKGYMTYQVAATVLTFLPEILSIIGLVMVGAALYMAISSVPSWVMAIGIIGIILLIPMIISAFGPRLIAGGVTGGEKVSESI